MYHALLIGVYMTVIITPQSVSYDLEYSNDNNYNNTQISNAHTSSHTLIEAEGRNILNAKDLNGIIVTSTSCGNHCFKSCKLQ
ncbi:unnamed protein product [Trichobilharzia szidati]|nr:unnamed protein product [Trichobilharzia szidati]